MVVLSDSILLKLPELFLRSASTCLPSYPCQIVLTLHYPLRNLIPFCVEHQLVRLCDGQVLYKSYSITEPGSCERLQMLGGLLLESNWEGMAVKVERLLLSSAIWVAGNLCPLG